MSNWFPLGANRSVKANRRSALPRKVHYITTESSVPMPADERRLSWGLCNVYGRGVDSCLCDEVEITTVVLAKVLIPRLIFPSEGLTLGL